MLSKFWTEKGLKFPVTSRGQPKNLRQGEVVCLFLNFRARFDLIFWLFCMFLHVYILTSPSAQNMGQVSQFKETTSPTSPSRLTPQHLSYIHYFLCKRLLQNHLVDIVSKCSVCCCKNLSWKKAMSSFSDNWIPDS